MNRLHPSWASIDLGTLATEMCLGKMLDKAKNTGELQPYLRNVNVRWFSFDLTDLKKMRFEPGEDIRFGLLPGDLVVCEGGEPGRAAVWRGESSDAKIQKALHRIRFGANEYLPQFAMYFVYYATITNQLARSYTGSTIKHLTGRAFANVAFPLPPFKEQERIVEKLDELFSELDAGVASLKRVQANLKRYRASILKSAVEGHLTGEWRAKNTPAESGQQFLDRILKERRKKWEASQLATYEANETKPPDNWKLRYKAPEAIGGASLPSIPSGWVWTTLDVAGVLDRGRSRHRPRNAGHLYGGPHPFVQTGDIRHADTFLNDYSQTYSEAGLGQSRMWPKGTLCITIAANIAETAILGFDGCFPDSVVGMLPASDDVSIRYVELYMRTVQERLENLAPATAQKNLNLETLRQVPICIPPLSEQRAIIEQADLLLSVAEAAEELLDKSFKRSNRLRQSILRDAFEGKLADQDPTDEPASVLLARIKSERQLSATNGTLKRRKSAGQNQAVTKKTKSSAKNSAPKRTRAGGKP